MSHVRAKRILCLLLAGLLTAASAFAADVPAEYTAKSKVTMGYFGTSSMLCLYDDYTQPGAQDRYLAVWEKVKGILQELDELLSVSIATSEISRFNALSCGESMPISAETAEVFSLAMEMYRKTEGYFNPAMYPLVDLWGFSPRFIYRDSIEQPYDRAREDGTRPLPDAEYVAAFLKLADPENIVLSGTAETGYVLAKNVPDVEVHGVVYHAQIDLGGIVKGYAVDRVKALLKEAGYEYGYFSCGSSSICLLKSAGKTAIAQNDPRFALEIRSPRETQSGEYARVSIMDTCLSSSGDYDNNYQHGEYVYCHIINPFTGYPLNVDSGTVQRGVSTVTLFSGNATEDDALTTALCLMGPRKAIDYINENLSGHEVVMMLYSADSSRYEVVTNLPQERLILEDDAYVLASSVDENGLIRYEGVLFCD